MWTAPTRRATTRWLVIGLTLRLLIALASVGTNDVGLWQRFGREATTSAFVDLWRTDGWMNHPPLPVLYARACYLLAGEHRYSFGLLIKLPGLLGDLSVIYLLGRAAPGDRSLAAAMYALNATAVLISGFHGNVDSLVAALGLWTWWLADRGRFGLAALALGVAINVKLVPAPTALLLLACVPSRRAFAVALAVLSAATMPFVAMTAAAGWPFLEATLAYRPTGYPWLMLPFTRWQSSESFGGLATGIVLIQAATAISVSFLWIAVLVLRRLRRGQPTDLVTLGALYGSGFLLWQGSAFQYLIWPLPLIAFARPRLALAYGWAGAAWLTWAYADAWAGHFPVESLFYVNTSTRSQIAVALPLAILVATIVSLWHDSPSDADRTGTRLASATRS